MESELLKTESSLTQILEKYADTVWRLCLVHMRNKADAEDVFQNVFVKLCKISPSFNDMEHAKAWLIKVTMNECKNQLKSFWRKNVIAIDEIVSPIKYENNRDVVKTLMQMPTKYRDVLYLHYFEEYKVHELAVVLKTNQSTVKTRLKRGRELLRNQLVKGGIIDE